MKKLCICLLTILLLATAAQAAEESPWTREEGNGEYITVRVPYPEGADLSWGDTRYLCVRYADTKEPVPLTSRYLQGYLFATVPAGDKDRPLEVFQGERFPWTDYAQWPNEPLGSNDLQVRGVILGDENGNLNDGDPLTRAEAFTILVRLLGLESAGDPGYSDVSAGDWFYDTVSAARAAGLAAQDATFRPGDSVSRSEFVTMVYRAFSRLGWTGPVEGTAADLSLADGGAIPDWALEAYLALGSQRLDLLPYTRQETGAYESSDGAPVYAYYAYPQQDATRGDVIQVVYRALSWLPVYPSDTAIRWGFDQGMPVIDGSTSTYPYTRALYGSLFHNCDGHPQYPAAHSKSHASYERLISGEADVLFAATKASKELEEQAREAGVELTYIPIAYDAMVFFTNVENSLDGVTLQQLQDIYVRNAYESWSELGGPAAALLPYCRNTDSGSHALMEQLILEGGTLSLHEDILRGNVSQAMSSALTDVAAALETDPPAYAIGYSVYYYYLTAQMMMGDVTDNQLKLLAIDGVAPSDETIADGSYPLSGHNYLVLRADTPADAPARRLAELLLSEEGQQIVENAGFGAIFPGESDDSPGAPLISLARAE